MLGSYASVPGKASFACRKLVANSNFHKCANLDTKTIQTFLSAAAFAFETMFDLTPGWHLWPETHRNREAWAAKGSWFKAVPP